MSNIFDALQRSQAERAQNDDRGFEAAIELLERAEREANGQRSLESLDEPRAEARTYHQGPVYSGESLRSIETGRNLNAATHVRQDDEQREIFSKFRVLEASQPKQSRLVCLGADDCPATEAFHLLGVRLQNMRKEREIKTLLITSTIPKEGKSMVASNLACTLGSTSGQKVLLVEGDVRRPTQSENFGLPQVPGLCDYLRGKGSLIDCLYQLRKAGIWILPAGDNHGDFREIIQSPQLPALITTLNSWFDWIVIDSPPVLPMVDTSIWSRLVDGILLVARQGTTGKRQLQKGLEAIDPTKLIGTILNSSKGTMDGYDYYYGRPDKASKHSKVTAH